ncbi:hypothetical protein CI109_100867 [Kwoniella shandongensis]|uniref:Uncharacterized protein n=1 Tax=Kwoniella shandongensis TaxID=1734106 RepID=A0A5M6BRM8_9TREE|nr:uncharacterized protein CI109_006119 [Kwoniella shandongensis]KAA5525546.1 hypothetical protein CI109_006119 [Kwoniella shandongensis]
MSPHPNLPYLPPDILHRVVSLLPLSSCYALALTCRSLRPHGEEHVWNKINLNRHYRLPRGTQESFRKWETRAHADLLFLFECFRTDPHRVTYVQELTLDVRPRHSTLVLELLGLVGPYLSKLVIAPQVPYQHRAVEDDGSDKFWDQVNLLKGKLDYLQEMKLRVDQGVLPLELLAFASLAPNLHTLHLHIMENKHSDPLLHHRKKIWKGLGDKTISLPNVKRIVFTFATSIPQEYLDIRHYAPSLQSIGLVINSSNLSATTFRQKYRQASDPTDIDWSFLDKLGQCAGITTDSLYWFHGDLASFKQHVPYQRLQSLKKVMIMNSTDGIDRYGRVEDLDIPPLPHLEELTIRVGNPNTSPIEKGPTNQLELNTLTSRATSRVQPIAPTFVASLSETPKLKKITILSPELIPIAPLAIDTATRRAVRNRPKILDELLHTNVQAFIDRFSAFDDGSDAIHVRLFSNGVPFGETLSSANGITNPLGSTFQDQFGNNVTQRFTTVDRSVWQNLLAVDGKTVSSPRKRLRSISTVALLDRLEAAFKPSSSKPGIAAKTFCTPSA